MRGVPLPLLLVLRCFPGILHPSLDFPGAAAFWGGPLPAITRACCCRGGRHPPSPAAANLLLQRRCTGGILQVWASGYGFFENVTDVRHCPDFERVFTSVGCLGADSSKMSPMFNVARIFERRIYTCWASGCGLFEHVTDVRHCQGL